jgi:CRP-like cAMP-binding protein
MLAYAAAPRNRAWLEPRNRLLVGLPPEDLRRLQPHLEPVTLPLRKVLFEPDESLTRIYLIEAGVVSLVTVFEDGTTVEMASVGREGLVGVGALLGGDSALGCYVVQEPGSALAVEASRFRAALRGSPALRMACEAYAQAFCTQLLQSVACNAAHTVERRCARRLLMSHDRSDGDTFPLTQELLAEMLGVRRSTVTLIDCALQKAGLIQYHRGAITVLDRRGLEAATCECYRVIRDRYEDLLPRTFA